MSESDPTISQIKEFYENDYYAHAGNSGLPSIHLKKLASSLNLEKSSAVLDIACGTGEWLSALSDLEHHVSGIDLSDKAIEICKLKMPEGAFLSQDAQTLPFPDNHFDFISCLGSLEHFPDKSAALLEMYRVVKPTGFLIILVPNSNFIGLRLGMFRGTQQKAILETPLSIREWKALFVATNLEVVACWKDTHILSRHWIMRKGIWHAPVRMVIALILLALPNKLQYQNYFRCIPKRISVI